MTKRTNALVGLVAAIPLLLSGCAQTPREYDTIDLANLNPSQTEFVDRYTGKEVPESLRPYVDRIEHLEGKKTLTDKDLVYLHDSAAVNIKVPGF